MAPVKHLLVSAGLLASVMADYVAFTEWPASLVAGQPVTLKWVGGSDAPATITLRQGASTDLQDVQVLTNSATNGEFNWTPPADLQNADDYAFQITQGDEINYTGMLPLSGGSDAPNANSLEKTQSGVENMSNSASATETAASVTGVSDSAASAATAAATGTTGTGTTTTTITIPTSSLSSRTDAESAAAAVTDTAASTGSAASDASGTTASGATASEGSSATASVSTETAKASKMNTPFVGSHMATPKATSSSSVQAGSAGSVGIPLALVAGVAGFLLLFV